MMASNRIGRINEEIRKELSALLRTVKDPRVAEAMLTITHVDTTTDLRQCRVYISALNCKDEKELMKGLKSAAGFLRRDNIRKYAEKLIEQYDVRSGQGPVTIARSMSGGNQQKAIVAREIDKNPELLVAVQPTRGLDVGAIEYIHKQLVAQRDSGKAVLLVSLELDEVMDVPDRILVMYDGEIVGELDPKTTTQEELGLYMAGAKRDEVKA